MPTIQWPAEMKWMSFCPLGRESSKEISLGELREPDRGAGAGDQGSEDEEAGGGDGVQHPQEDRAEQGGGGQEAAFHHGGEFVASVI